MPFCWNSGSSVTSIQNYLPFEIHTFFFCFFLSKLCLQQIKYKQQSGFLAQSGRIWQTLAYFETEFGILWQRIIYTLEGFMTKKQNLENHIWYLKVFGLAEFESDPRNLKNFDSQWEIQYGRSKFWKIFRSTLNSISWGFWGQWIRNSPQNSRIEIAVSMWPIKLKKKWLRYA